MFTREELDLLYRACYKELKARHYKTFKYKQEDNVDSIKLSKLQQRETEITHLMNKITKEIESLKTDKEKQVERMLLDKIANTFYV